MHVCQHVEPIKKRIYFCNKICYLIKNYYHHGKNQLCQEVGDGYIFVNVIVKITRNIWLIILYGAVLSKKTV